jgi:acetoacetate decarboxylase
MPITSEPRMHNGRDIFGFPKKMANIHLEREGKTAHGWVERYGITFVEITVELTGSLPALPPTGPTYLFKGMPRIDLQPGFDGPVFLAKQQTTVELVSCEIGSAQVTLTSAEHDPWAELGDIQPMIAFMLESNNTMHPGEIIREVDPMAYLPHYFHFTDFSAGKSEE